MTATANDMRQVIGKTATLFIDGLTVGVTILDVKHVYGATRYAVSPINGNGVKWVMSDRVLVDGTESKVSQG